MQNYIPWRVLARFTSNFQVQRVGMKNICVNFWYKKYYHVSHNQLHPTVLNEVLLLMRGKLFNAKLCNLESSC